MQDKNCTSEMENSSRESSENRIRKSLEEKWKSGKSRTGKYYSGNLLNRKKFYDLN